MAYAETFLRELPGAVESFVNVPEATTGVTEYCDQICLEKSVSTYIGFQLFRETGRTADGVSVNHMLQFRSTGRELCVLGAPIEMSVGTVCQARESTSGPAEMFMKHGARGDLGQQVVADLVMRGLLIDPSTAEAVKPIRATLEEFAIMYGLGADLVTRDIQIKAGEAFVAENNKIIKRLGRLTVVEESLQKEAIMDGTFVDVRRRKFPDRSPFHCVKITRGTTSTLYTDHGDERLPSVKIMDEPVLAGGSSKEVTMQQIEVDMHDADLLQQVVEMDRRGIFQAPTTRRESSVLDAPEQELRDIIHILTCAAISAKWVTTNRWA